jgi:hypothetical protein
MLPDPKIKLLLIENAQQSRQAGAAVESPRNAIIGAQERLQDAARQRFLG